MDSGDGCWRGQLDSGRQTEGMTDGCMQVVNGADDPQ